MKHTAGKWKWMQGDKIHHKELYVEPGADSILYHGANWPMDEANAKLIAAAPAMIEALKGVVAALTQNKTFHCDIELAKSFAKAAIAKAEGK